MDKFNRTWITEHAIEEIRNYEKGVLTLRGLHYRLVAAGMTNSQQHYKRVVAALIKARWEGLVDFDTFSDHDRAIIGETDWKETDLDTQIETAQFVIKDWMNVYYKNKWENQPYYPEVFIEKKALQGVFGPVCSTHNIALGPCKGYPSLTFVNESAIRFKEAVKKGKTPIILYFGDHDPSGEDIPRSIEENLKDMGVYVEVRIIALMKHQVIDWKLPPAPAKETDSRTANWDGLGQVELDAVEPKKIQKLCGDAIKEIFDEDLYNELMSQESDEREEYVIQLKDYVQNL